MSQVILNLALSVIVRFLFSIRLFYSSWELWCTQCWCLILWCYCPYDGVFVARVSNMILRLEEQENALGHDASVLIWRLYTCYQKVPKKWIILKRKEEKKVGNFNRHTPKGSHCIKGLYSEEKHRRKKKREEDSHNVKKQTIRQIFTHNSRYSRKENEKSSE